MKLAIRLSYAVVRCYSLIGIMMLCDLCDDYLEFHMRLHCHSHFQSFFCICCSCDSVVLVNGECEKDFTYALLIPSASTNENIINSILIF